MLALPVPAVAREMLDIAGRWGKERVPQRRLLDVGTHLREGRGAAPGRTRRRCCTSGSPASASRTADLGLHTAWSGNHTHYAERLSTGEQVVGGGELLLPGRGRARARARRTRRRGSTPPTAAGWTRWPGGSTGTCGPAAASGARPARHPQRLGGGLLRPRPRPAARARRDARPRSASSATCSTTGGSGARSDACRPRRLDGLARRLARRPAPAGRQGRGLGMQFGLWFEPEMVNVDSEVGPRAPRVDHGHRRPAARRSRSQQVINLGIPECYAYVRDAIFAIWASTRSATSSGTTTGT